jgi:ankyrin repeat protein
MDNILVGACIKKNLEVIKGIIELDSKLVNIKDKTTGLYPILIASVLGNVEIVKLLLRSGADVNVMYCKTKPLIHCICEVPNFNSFDVINVLLNAGVSIEQDYFGKTPLCTACGANNLNLVEYLVNMGANFNGFGVDRDDFLRTPISCTQSAAITKFLLDKGADPNIIDKNGKNVLHHNCSHFDNYEIVSVLIGYGKMDINKEDSEGYSSLWYSISEGYNDITKLLLESGALISFDVDGMYIEPFIWKNICLARDVAKQKSELL